MPWCGFLTCDGPDEVDEVELAGPDEVERCSCDESVALRRELASAHARLETTREAYRAWRAEALRASAPRPIDTRRLAVTSAGETYNGLD